MRRRSSWTAEELAAFLDAARDGRLEGAWHLALKAGLRIGEVLALRWVDVDPIGTSLDVRNAVVGVRHSAIKHPAGSCRERAVGLDPGTAALLNRLRRGQRIEKAEWGSEYGERGLVICREDGEPVHSRDLDRAFRRVVERAGVRPIPLAALRRTGAGASTAQGVPS